MMGHLSKGTEKTKTKNKWKILKLDCYEKVTGLFKKKPMVHCNIKLPYQTISQKIQHNTFIIDNNQIQSKSGVTKNLFKSTKNK